MTEITKESCASAAREGRLAAAVLAAEPVESELSCVVYALTVATIETTLTHAHHAARARERARR